MKRKKNLPKFQAKVYAFLLMLFIVLLSAGCEEPKETPVKGELTVYADESFYPVVAAVADTFAKLYPEAKIATVKLTAREGITKVLNNEAELFVSSRRMNTEEEAFAKQQKVEVKTIKYCYDGVVMIVNAADTTTLIPFQEIQNLMRKGKFRNINKVYAPSLNSGITELLADSLEIPHAQLQVTMLPDENEVIKAVQNERGSAGFIGYYSFLQNQPKVRSLKAGLKEQLGIKDVYYEPHPGFFVQKLYPLTRMGVVLLNEVNIGLASGFATFLAGNIGQKMTLDAGLAPAAVPVRLK